MQPPIHDLAITNNYVAAPGQSVFALPCRLFPGHEGAFVVTRDGVASVYNPAGATAASFSTVATGPEGLNIVFGAPLAGGELVTCRRQLPKERLTSLPESGPISVAALNLELSYLTALVQDADAYTQGPPGARGDPGGDATQIGTKAQAPTISIPVGIDLVRITGNAIVGDQGAGDDYVADAAADTVGDPAGTFTSFNGRKFRKAGLSELKRDRRADVDRKIVDVFVVYPAQSNGAGNVLVPVNEPAEITKKATMWNGAAQVPLALNMPLSTGGNGVGGMWPAFANEYVARTGRRCLFVNCAKNSQSIDDLSKVPTVANTNWAQMVAWTANAIASIAAAGDTVGNVRMVMVQGEQDMLLGTFYNAYLTKLAALWADIKANTAVNFLWIITSFTRRSTAYWPNTFSIWQAQRNFALDNADVAIAFDDADKFFETSGLDDGLHATQYGYNLAGSEAAKRVADRVLVRSALPATAEDIRKNGTASLNPFQRYTRANISVQRGAANWPALAFGAGRASGFIRSIDETTDSNELRLMLASPSSQVLEYFAMLGNPAGEQGLRVEAKCPLQTDETAANYLALRFYWDVEVLVDFAAQTVTAPILTGGVYTALIPTLFTASGWGTGQVTLDHPTSKHYATGNIAGANGRHLRIQQTSVTRKIVNLTNLADAAVNDQIVLSFKGLLLPLANLPASLDLTAGVTCAAYRQ
jgi:hypothetical protein